MTSIKTLNLKVLIKFIMVLWTEDSDSQIKLDAITYCIFLLLVVKKLQYLHKELKWQDSAMSVYTCTLSWPKKKNRLLVILRNLTCSLGDHDNDLTCFCFKIRVHLENPAWNYLFEFWNPLNLILQIYQKTTTQFAMIFFHN